MESSLSPYEIIATLGVPLDGMTQRMIADEAFRVRAEDYASRQNPPQLPYPQGPYGSMFSVLGADYRPQNHYGSNFIYKQQSSLRHLNLQLHGFLQHFLFSQFLGLVPRHKAVADFLHAGVHLGRLQQTGRGKN